MVMLLPFTGFANLLESIVLLMNAMAILNEHYFLKHCRLGLTRRLAHPTA